MTGTPRRTIPAVRVARTTEAGSPRGLVKPGAEGTSTQVGWADAAAVDRVVAVAVEARREWARTSAENRAARLRAIAAELRSRVAEFGVVIASESGKRVNEADGEVEFSAKYFDWFADAAERAEVEQRLSTAGRSFRVLQHPIGVVAAVGTWNFPLSIPARKIAAAVAAGCPTILKASERTPEAANLLVELCERHLPTGVIGSIMGDGAILVPALIDHPDVAAVTFTGSTIIGARVGARAAATQTRSVLELGGRAPFIVRADADIDQAIENLIVAKFRNSGQSCIAANNVFVHSSLRDRFWEAIAARISRVRPGDPFDPDSDFGPLIDESAVRRLETILIEAAGAGMSVVRGARGTGPNQMRAALVECTDDLAIWTEELFGPVIPLRSFENEDDLVDEINAWGTGLAGYICSSDITSAAALASRLRIGIVGINNGAPNTPEVPLGGFGSSGVGREGGMSGYLEFIEEQTVSIAT